TADPEREVMAAAGPWLLVGAAVFGAAFWWWQRHTPRAIVPSGLLGPRRAWGALVVSLLVGAALIAALVDIPVFARTTVHGGDQLGAAFELLRFLVALPVGAVLGGWLTRRYGRGAITAAGLVLAGLMFMSSARCGTSRPRPCWCCAVSGSGWPSRPSTPRSSPRRRTTATASPVRSSWSRGWSGCWSACRRSPPSGCAGTSR